MRRALAAVPAVVLALACSPAGAAQAPLLPAPAIPPELQALETKADALQITSARVSISTSLRLGHASKVARELARLLEIKIEGVETSSPPAAALSVTMFGAHVRLRYVGGRAYLFSWDIGLHDGGRPWIALGHGPVGRLFTKAVSRPQRTSGSGAERWRKLFTLVNDGINIHEIAPATLYGQPVTGFQEELETKAVGEANPARGALGAFSAATRPAPAPAPKPTLTIYFAAGGAPVRVQVHSGSGRVGATITADVPAIDFPYTVPPPPPAHLIAEAKLLKRFASRRHTRSVTVGRGSKSKQ
jgi:hypothetical protein